MSRPANAERARTPESRPTAAAVIEPVGPRESAPRTHAMRLHLPISSFDDRIAERRGVIDLAEVTLRLFAGDEPPTYFDVLARDKVVAIEAVRTLADTPTRDAIGLLRHTLTAAGYQVSLRLLRECDEAGCTTSASLDPGREASAPSGWFSANTCGKHGYRLCAGCDSLYSLTSTSGSGQSVHCEVCGGVLIEWGASKCWTADLVKRGRD